MAVNLEVKNVIRSGKTPGKYHGYLRQRLHESAAGSAARKQAFPLAANPVPALADVQGKQETVALNTSADKVSGIGPA